MKKNLSMLGVVLVVGVLFTGCTFPWDKEPTDDVIVEDDTLTEDKGLISFYSEPKEIDYKEIFIGEKLNVLNKYWHIGDKSGFDDQLIEVMDEWMMPKVYELGSFNEGDYVGQKFYLVQINCDGPCFTTPYYRITINSDGTWTSFTRYSNAWDEWLIELAGNLFDSYDNLLISQLEYPETLTDANGTIFEKVKDDPNSLIKDTPKREIFMNDDIGSVYINTDNQCTVAVLPDGTTQSYDMVINFSTGVNNYGSYDVESLGKSAGEVFDVTWTDGTKAEDMYSYKGAYSFGPCLYDKRALYPDLYSMDQLTQIGTTAKGDGVYGFKSSDSQPLKDFYDMAFPSYMTDENGQALEKPTYEEFVATHPLFYWEDAYGRLIEFGKSEYQPAAEMGKPVIYLYPEDTLTANVKVDPTNGISVSDPEYGLEGWNVIAHKDGSLFNLADQEVYPYLFWEGLSLDYQMPREGFVVASINVGRFLNEKLAVLGLNDNEIADFMEFWYPKFDSAPYYYITFMPQEDFEKIAPLSVTPSPDTVIRVYMDYAPLSGPIEVTEPELVTPDRDGFTVVEWGGALHKSFR